jgi:bifunctional non-homologous end joining protein LigD
MGEYLVVDNVTALISLVQANVLELHTWNATVDRIECPDRIVLDLDPGPDVSWRSIVEAAQLVRTALQALGLESFVKTTGGRGLHVVVPLVPKAEWQLGLAVARGVAEAIARLSPQHYTTAFAKAGREGKILIDFMRNNRLSTSVAAFSTRARPGAPISTPLAWEELDKRLKGSTQYTVRNLAARLKRIGADPWAGYWKTTQRLTTRTAERVGKIEF